MDRVPCRQRSCIGTRTDASACPAEVIATAAQGGAAHHMGNLHLVALGVCMVTVLASAPQHSPGSSCHCCPLPFYRRGNRGSEEPRTLNPGQGRANSQPAPEAAETGVKPGPACTTPAPDPGPEWPAGQGGQWGADFLSGEYLIWPRPGSQSEFPNAMLHTPWQEFKQNLYPILAAGAALFHCVPA